MQAVANRGTNRLSLDKNMEKKARAIYKQFGLSLSDAVNIFLSQSVRCHGLPFEMKLPDEAAKRAIEEAEKEIELGPSVEEILCPERLDRKR